MDQNRLAIVIGCMGSLITMYGGVILEPRITFIGILIFYIGLKIA